MELRHLRYFLAVAEELHFGRAAEKLHIAQPPLSQQIQNLEDELGVELFERSVRPIKLTAAGGAFRARAKAILEKTDEAAKEAQLIGQGQLGQLVLSFMSTATLTKLPKILKGFRLNFPNVDIKLEQMTSSEQLIAVANGSADIGFVSVKPFTSTILIDNTPILVEPAWEEKLAVALPADHKLAKRKTISIENLADEYFIDFPRSPHFGYFDQVINLCVSAGFTPKATHQVSQLQTALALISAGYGIALMPEDLRTSWSSDVTFVPLKKRVAITINAISKQENTSPVIQAFRKSLEK